MIYGVALLAACMFVGSLIGNLLGLVTGLGSDVGGVGFAMLLLLLITNSKKIAARLPKGIEKGIEFWKGMYIPVVIAMSASQNVFQAFSGGLIALIAGIAAVGVAFLLLMLLNRLAAKKGTALEKEETEEAEA